MRYRLDDGNLWESLTLNHYVARVRIGTQEYYTEPREARPVRDIIRNNAEIDASVTYVNRPYVASYPLCSFCGSRPQQGEYDCDGFHYMSTCEHPQCVPGDVRRGSRNLSASVEARGL